MRVRVRVRVRVCLVAPGGHSTTLGERVKGAEQKFYHRPWLCEQSHRGFDQPAEQQLLLVYMPWDRHCVTPSS